MRQPKDLTSKQFGLLVALYRKTEGGRSKWVCQCRCGKQKMVRQEDLLNGRTKSCGCSQLQLMKAKAEKRYSLVNRKFGRLLVLWKSKNKTSRSMIWDCRCDCGKVIPVAGTKLRTGKVRSCGCLQQDAAKILDKYIRGTLSFEEFITACERVLNPPKRKENATS